jgi:sugar/nucleoside kinase (ribokinase family)
MLTFVGHVSVDKVSNPNGVKVQPGGACLYSALAAKTLMKDVQIITAVGLDYPFKDVVFSNFSSIGVKLVNMPSTRFEIEYDGKWGAHYKVTFVGAGSKILVRDVTRFPKSSHLHLSPMNPSKVLRMVKFARERLPNATLSMSTCFHYLNSSNRRLVVKAAEDVDMVFLSELEFLRLLDVRRFSMQAFKSLKSRMAILTLGDLGALVKEGDTIHFAPALMATKKPKDVTGAGDTWCGAFLASYALTKDATRSASVASIIATIKCSGWGFEKLFDIRFKAVEEVFDYALSLADKQPKLWDFLSK